MSELFCTYRRTGDKAVRNEIVMQSMHIVRYAVISTRNMFLRFTDEDDISNEAVLALISAAWTACPEGCAALQRNMTMPFPCSTLSLTVSLQGKNWRIIWE